MPFLVLPHQLTASFPAVHHLNHLILEKKTKHKIKKVLRKAYILNIYKRGISLPAAPTTSI